MKKIFHPNKKIWNELIIRPSINAKKLHEKVAQILENVRVNGDEAIRSYTKSFDDVDLQQIELNTITAKNETNEVSESIKQAIQMAHDNIKTFHESQIDKLNYISVQPGVVCWRQNLPIERVGLYIPGGTAPLISTLLMLGVPAKLAGCKEIVLCTPPDKNGDIDPVMAYLADYLGIEKIYRCGGAQAIAAMGFGTETIPKVDKLFGPGNQYVMEAKNQMRNFGVGIDLPAGPSELLLMADHSCNPAFVAADLLSQAEHGPDSQVLLLTTHSSIVDEVYAEIEKQIATLPRKKIIREALEHSMCIVLADLVQAIEFSNLYAPEHLILAVNNPRSVAKEVINAGSVFLGNYSPESAGDYASGTNHTLPTNGFARMYSGVSMDSYYKKITFQEITHKGLEKIGPAIETLAQAETLEAHRRAVSIRLKDKRYV